MPRERSRSSLPIALAGLALVAAILWWNREGRTPPPSSAERSATRRVETEGSAEAEEAAEAEAKPETADGAVPHDMKLPETPWAAVDMDKIREAMPDNMYWKMSMPTKDEAVIRERAEERARWNVEYGKVLSNTATAEEIDAYYALQHRLSSDYVEFATYLLAEFGDKLPIRDVGLLKVAVELNLARLEEIPRHIADAHERRKAHDAVRRAWLEEQKAFDRDDSR